MNSGELFIHERNCNELAILREYTQRAGKMVCGRQAWGEEYDEDDDCQCFSCSAREALQTVEILKELYKNNA